MVKGLINDIISLTEKHRVLRYIISGGCSASVNIIIFSFFFYIVSLNYIVSNVFGFILGFVVSLILQKFWTFKDRSTERIHIQSILYLLNSLFGLGLNTLILYLCVKFLGVYPLLGVIISGIVTALFTFQISSRFVFNRGL